MRLVDGGGYTQKTAQSVAGPTGRSQQPPCPVLCRNRRAGPRTRTARGALPHRAPGMASAGQCSPRASPASRLFGCPAISFPPRGVCRMTGGDVALKTIVQATPDGGGAAASSVAGRRPPPCGLSRAHRCSPTQSTSSTASDVGRTCGTPCSVKKRRRIVDVVCGIPCTCISPRAWNSQRVPGGRCDSRLRVTLKTMPGGCRDDDRYDGISAASFVAGRGRGDYLWR